MKFRKKPVVVEALQYTGDNAAEVRQFVGADRCTTMPVPGDDAGMFPPMLIIATLEGDHRAIAGDWIIRGVRGEFYPCKPDIFTETYDPAEV